MPMVATMRPPFHAAGVMSATIGRVTGSACRIALAAGTANADEAMTWPVLFSLASVSFFEKDFCEASVCLTKP